MLGLIWGGSPRVEKQSGLRELERSARYGKTRAIRVHWSDGDVTWIKADDRDLREWEQEALYNCNRWLETKNDRWHDAAVAKIGWGVESAKIDKIEIRQ